MSMEDRPPQLQPPQELRGMTNPLSRASATSWFREERNGYAGGWEQDVQLQDGAIEVGVSWSLRYVAENGQEVEYDEGPTGRMSGVERVRYEDRLMWVSAILQEEVRLRQERATLGIDPDPRQQPVINLLEELHQRLFDYLQIDIQREEEARMHMMKVSVEEAVTENVEQLLRDLDKPLEVVHNVSLQEVKQNLPVWIPSVGKEVTTLTSSGTLRPIPLSLAKQKAEKGEIKLVPGKTVHTVKPPDVVGPAIEDKREYYKRKTRLVICGNYIAEGGTEVYTAAATAESLRCSLAVSAHRAWNAGTTDINSAFTLTPTTESKVQRAITIPKVVVDAGYAEEGMAYMVERVLYGLREAPRLWGGFRDRRVRNAKLYLKEIEYQFSQMETDESVWRLHPVSEPMQTVALMVIYVDDVLFLGEEEIIMVMYQWITEGEGAWKCSPLEMVTQKEFATWVWRSDGFNKPGWSVSMSLRWDIQWTFCDNMKDTTW